MVSYEKFKELLERRGENAQDVCRATGIAAATISDWKRGKSDPKTLKLHKIAEYFGVTIEYFIVKES